MMLEILLEFGPYGPRSKPVPGELWRASYVDRVTHRMPGGSADTPWEAIAWMLADEEAARRGILVIAHDSRDTPASYLAKVLAGQVTPSALPLISEPPPPDLASPGVPPTVPLERPKKTAAARRARSKRT